MVQIKVVLEMDQNSTYGLDMEYAAKEYAAKEIQKEIDESIMADILTEAGWTTVIYRYKNNQQAVDITDWLIEHCSNDWHRLGIVYMFKNKQDAEWFILRWT